MADAAATWVAMGLRLLTWLPAWQPDVAACAADPGDPLRLGAVRVAVWCA